MSLPNLSYMVSVGQLRYIQSAYEVPEHRNPDALIHHFGGPHEGGLQPGLRAASFDGHPVSRRPGRNFRPGESMSFRKSS